MPGAERALPPASPNPTFRCPNHPVQPPFSLLQPSPREKRGIKVSAQLPARPSGKGDIKRKASLVLLTKQLRYIPKRPTFGISHPKPRSSPPGQLPAARRPPGTPKLPGSLAAGARFTGGWGGHPPVGDPQARPPPAGRAGRRWPSGGALGTAAGCEGVPGQRGVDGTHRPAGVRRSPPRCRGAAPHAAVP